MASDAGAKLAASIRKAMRPLQDARSDSAKELKALQAKVYGDLWVALETYNRETGRDL